MNYCLQGGVEERFLPSEESGLIRGDGTPTSQVQLIETGKILFRITRRTELGEMAVIVLPNDCKLRLNYLAVQLTFLCKLRAWVFLLFEDTELCFSCGVLSRFVLFFCPLKRLWDVFRVYFSTSGAL